MCKIINLLVLLLSIVNSITCNDDEVYMKFSKNSNYNYGSQSWEVYDGETQLYRGWTTASGLYIFEKCLPKTTNNQYTLKLKQSSSNMWVGGSWLMVEGIYGNRVFKNFLASENNDRSESFPLSLYTPIIKNDVWKLTSGSASENWITYSFSDTDWSEVTLGSVTTAVSGTQYFRKTFVGLANLAAYELSMNYRYGIVAYVNGVEIFRDNMGSGDIESSSLAIASYENLAYHSIIRPAIEISSAQSVLAVEIHFPANVTQTTVDFDGFVSMIASNVYSSNPCFIFPYDVEISASAGKNPTRVFDFTKNEYYSLTHLQAPADVTYSFNGVKAVVNGISIFPHFRPDYNPKELTFQGSFDNTDYTTIFSVEDIPYTRSQYTIFSGYFFANLYNHYRLRFTKRTTTEVYEIQPLICSIPAPTSIEYDQSEYTIYARFEDISIKPKLTGITGCTITPALPSGLVFDSTLCHLSGRVNTPSSTVFTVSAVLEGSSYSGSFTLNAIDCTGTMVNIVRTYGTNSNDESFSIKDAQTDEVVLEVAKNTVQQNDRTISYLMCLTGSIYTVAIDGYYDSSSNLQIRALLDGENYERIIQLRNNDKLGTPKVYTFNLQYAVKTFESWNYKMGEVPAEWYNSDMTGWTSGIAGSLPTSTSQIQLYKRSFSISSLDGFAGISISLKYRYGVIIYLNNHEVFRKGVTGDLSTTTASTTSLTAEVFSQITLPIKSMSDGTTSVVDYVVAGSNTIAIALVGVNGNQPVSFNCAIRLMHDSVESRYWSIQSEFTGFSDRKLSVFSIYDSAYLKSTTCDENSATITFGNDIHEWISSFAIRLHQDQNTEQPRNVIVKAKNAEDTEWTTIKTVEGMVWSLFGEQKRIWLTNSKAYNQYRFENFASGSSTDCTWRLAVIYIYNDATQIDVPALSYPTPIEIIKDIELAEVYPSSEYYTDYSISPALPSGIMMDPYTGVLSGVTHEIIAQKAYTITAKKFNSGESVTFELPIGVLVCSGDKSLITMVIRSDEFPENSLWKLHQGKGTSGSVVASVDKLAQKNTLLYTDFCLDHGIYTLYLWNRMSGLNAPGGYYFSVDEGEMKFEMDQFYIWMATQATKTTMFSSYLPFQIEYDQWKVYKKGNVDPNWNTIAFDDSEWPSVIAADIGAGEAYTTYIRKSFDIPSLDDYHVLNVRMKYEGGIAAYFNGNLVARFNLVENFHAETRSIRAHNVITFSQFHIVLPVEGAVAGKNVIAFEVHVPIGKTISSPVIFDATGVFGVNDCSICLDSVINVSGTTPTGNTISSLYDFFDLTPLTYGTLPNEVGTYIQWTVENLEGSKFNSFALGSHTSLNEWGFSLYGRENEYADTVSDAPAYTTLFQGTDLSTIYKTRTSWSTPIGITGYRQLKWEVDAKASNQIIMNSVSLQYCKPANTVCASVDGYLPVAEGEISVHDCPSGYTGYAYRTCTNGQFGDVQLDKCTLAAPNMHYYKPKYYLRTNSDIEIVPSGTGANLTVTVTSGSLPSGITIDSTTGVISGSLTDENFSDVSITVSFSNSIGSCTDTLTLYHTIDLSFVTYPQPFYTCSMTELCQIIPSTSGGDVRFGLQDYHNLPNGLTMNDVTGVLSGYPKDKEGSYVITIRMENDYEDKVEQVYLVLKSDGNAACAGTIGRIIYTYTTFSELATFTVTEDRTGVPIMSITNAISNDENRVVYEFCALGSQHTLTYTGGFGYLPPGSYFIVQLLLANDEYETVGRLSFNQAYLNQDKEFHFDALYSISGGSTWYTKSGSIPENWTDSNVEGWTVGSVNNFESVSGRIQLYKRYYASYNADHNIGYVLSLRYQYGCIVYVSRSDNLFIEIYRDGIEGDLSDASVATTEYSGEKYRQIVLHPDTLPWVYSPSMIAVALVGKDDNQAPVFDLALRHIGFTPFSSRMFDYSITSTFENAENAFDLSHTTTLSSATCDTNSIDIQFDNNRLEWINAIEIQVAKTQTTAIPTQFLIKAKNPADEEWTLLHTVTGLQFALSNRQRLIFGNDHSYNMYRIENIQTGDESACNWELTHIDLANAHTAYSAPSYTAQVLYVGDLVTIYPTYPYAYNYAATSLPSGLSVDPMTGVISGTPTEVSSKKTYTVTSTHAWGRQTRSTISIQVKAASECTDGEIIEINSRNAAGSTTPQVYASEDLSTVITSENRYCYPPGIYAARAYTGYQFKVEDFVFNYGVTTSTNYQKFSSVIPFKSTSEWKVSKGAMEEGWNGVEFDSSSWETATSATIGAFEATTVYIRKEFTIPSLAEYHTLNVQVKYTEGIIAYFNGHKIARFNLPEMVDSTTFATDGSFEPITSTFSIILSANDATTDKNVIAFEIHSAYEGEHPVIFSAVGAFGVNECNTLTNSVSGRMYNNIYSEYYQKRIVDGDVSTKMDILRTNRYAYLHFAIPEVFDGYFNWSVDNLEPVQYNAFSYSLESVSYKSYVDCELEWQVPSMDGKYTTIATSLNEESTGSMPSNNLVSDTVTASREFRLSIPRSCHYSTGAEYSNLIPYLNEVYLSYCVVPSCPADGDYPSVMNGQLSTIRCPTGYYGFKSRRCVNGVLEETIEESCTPVNSIHYDREDTLLIMVNTEVMFIPTTDFPISFFSISGDLPSGLTFDTSSGKISGTVTESIHEFVFTVTGIDEQYSCSTEVTLIVVDMEVCAITKDALVFDSSDSLVAKMDTIVSTNYDYYQLSETEDYIIIKQEGATVIPMVGAVWKYVRPALSLGHDVAPFDGGTGEFVYQITKEDLFTHYHQVFTSCPWGMHYVSVHSLDTALIAQHCVKANVPFRVSTEVKNIVVRDSENNVIPIAARHSLYNLYVVSLPYREYDPIFTDPESAGIISYGPYYTWPRSVYENLMMMRQEIFSSSSSEVIIRFPLTFDLEKKKSLFDASLLPALEGDPLEYDKIEPHNNYVTETALTLMEIVYQMKHNEAIQFSRSHLKEVVAEQCTIDDCTGIFRVVMDALQQRGVCKEGETGHDCQRYKMVGFNQEATVTRNTKWIKDQIDAGNPVYTLLSLNSGLTQHHTSLNTFPINKAAPGLLNFGGVIIGYNAEREGYEYWEVAVHRHGEANNLIKVKMDLGGKNFARMTNYAFTIADVM